MREIKFRGKSMISGEWFYGDLVRLPENEHTLTTIFNKDVGYREVDPDTVGQYTGFADKNGKEIYEGDILENYDQALVTFRDGTFKLEWLAGYTASELNEGFDETTEVVGNAVDWGIDYDK